MGRHRGVFVCGMVAGIGVAAAGAMLGVGRGQPEDRIVGLAATDEKLFRVWESGRIEFLVVDLDNGTAEGVPDWTPVQIDTTRMWDSRGKAIRKK